MPKLTNSHPKYRKRSSGSARVATNGRDYLLGPHGTKAGKLKYDQIIAEGNTETLNDSHGYAARRRRWIVMYALGSTMPKLLRRIELARCTEPRSGALLVRQSFRCRGSFELLCHWFHRLILIG